MTFFNEPPYCDRCNGIGNIFADLDIIEDIPSLPFVKECPTCKGSGINKVHDISRFRGEMIQYSGSLGPQIGVFMKEMTRSSSQILLGRQLIVVPNDAITFLRSFYASFYPMFDPVYRKTIYEALGLA